MSYKGIWTLEGPVTKINLLALSVLGDQNTIANFLIPESLKVSESS